MEAWEVTENRQKGIVERQKLKNGGRRECECAKEKMTSVKGKGGKARENSEVNETARQRKCGAAKVRP